MSAQHAAIVEPFYTTSDLGSMKLFVRQFVDRVRYVPGIGWYTWDGKRWRKDDTGAIWRFAKLVPAAWEEEAARAEGAGMAKRADSYRSWAYQSESASKLANLLKLAETDSTVVTRPALLDGDPMLFNASNGTVDLRSGNVLSHQQIDLITKLGGAACNPAAEAPAWEAFLARVVPDAAVYGYLQRAIGYSLTGLTGEQVFFLLHGSGANGKSTFLNALAYVLGDYATFAPPETFMARHNEQVSNDIAALTGARVVITSETEEGQRFAESLVKRLTGGDIMVGRFLYHEFFSFRPVFKLWLAANHLPGVRGQDDSMWRRVHLIPFTQSIPPQERDPMLLERLKAEAAGILAWALMGCLHWQERGLQPPPAVLAATAGYRSDQDQLGLFLDECCVYSPPATVGKSELFGRWQSWCEQNNERAGTLVAFGRRLKERPGITEARTGHHNQHTWVGIGLRQASQ